MLRRWSSLDILSGEGLKRTPTILKKSSVIPVMWRLDLPQVELKNSGEHRYRAKRANETLRTGSTGPDTVIVDGRRTLEKVYDVAYM